MINPSYIEKIYQKKIAKLGGELAENKVILNEYMQLHKELRDKIELIHELIEEYRTSKCHTLARAHITLFKIDTDVLGNSVNSDSLRTDE